MEKSNGDGFLLYEINREKKPSHKKSSKNITLLGGGGWGWGWNASWFQRVVESLALMEGNMAAGLALEL